MNGQHDKHRMKIVAYENTAPGVGGGRPTEIYIDGEKKANVLSMLFKADLSSKTGKLGQFGVDDVEITFVIKGKCKQVSSDFDEDEGRFEQEYDLEVPKGVNLGSIE